MVNREALKAFFNNREELLKLASKMNREELLAMDATLDTMVFGEPLGLMGEGFKTGESCPLFEKPKADCIEVRHIIEF